MVVLGMFWKCLKSLVLIMVVMACGNTAQAKALKIRVLYAEQQFERPAVLSGMRPVPDDLGLQGARLGIADNISGGKFLQQDYVLEEVIAAPGERLVDKLKLADAPDFVILNAPADVIIAIADLPGAKDKIIFNVGARDERLREADCRANVLHTGPSYAMLADAVAQFLLVKKWTNIMLLAGGRDNDKLYAEAFRRAATKFGLTLAADKPWSLEADMRESAATEIPLLTQDADTDVVVVADENDDFGPLIPFNTYYARPVLGTHGLMATGWSDVIETWGARQLQNRFEVLAKRPMRETDFAAYLAARVVSEGVLRLKTGDVKQLRSFILSEDLQLSAFKGRGLTFRSWNGQLRQPIHLVTKDAQISEAPYEAFLHEVTDLDTLGIDRPETKCERFK
jgi:ABC transporter substrate binding protein (PQQ-dependent alcohol dehydrogenase system)